MSLRLVHGGRRGLVPEAPPKRTRVELLEDLCRAVRVERVLRAEGVDAVSLAMLEAEVDVDNLLRALEPAPPVQRRSRKQRSTRPGGAP